MATDSEELKPVLSLLQVLVQTASALALGFFCVRYGFIDPSRGDMQALQFFIGRVALPLMVFKVVATSDIGDLDVGVILACALGKVVSYVLTFSMTWFAYRSKDPVGKRMLTAGVFGFFTMASNDLALGFPVMQAIYGSKMSVYLAANVLAFQVLLQPLCMIQFEIAHAVGFEGAGDGPPGAVTLAPAPTAPAVSVRPIGALRNNSSRVSLLLTAEQQEKQPSARDRWRSVAASTARSVALNPIMIATLLGVLYNSVLNFTLVRGPNGDLSLPPPFGGIVQLWTSPFTMMFLFLNGTSLRSANIGLWPAMLAVMKVLLCSYTSFGFSQVLVNPNHPEAQILKEFTFFYGTIPAGGAPLIYAQLFDCGASIVASASILCLVLSGPIEFVTALFLGTVAEKVNYADVRYVMFGAAQGSAACAGLFAALVAVGWWGGSFSSRAIGVYGFLILFYELWTLLAFRGNGWGCTDDVTGALAVYTFLQNVGYILVVYIEWHLGTRWNEGRRARSHVVTLAVLSVAGLASWLVPKPNTYHELCGRHPRFHEAVMLVAWNTLLFVLIVVAAVRGRASKERAKGVLPVRNKRQGTWRMPLLGGGEAAAPDAAVGGAGGAGGVVASSPGGAKFVTDSSPMLGSPPPDPSPSKGFGASSEMDGTGANQERPSPGGDGVGVATCLVILQGVRSLMGIINCSAQAWQHISFVEHRGFTPMLILEDILEHGQGIFLFLAVIFQPNVLAETRNLLMNLGACGCCGGIGSFGVVAVAVPEVEPHTPYVPMTPSAYSHARGDEDDPATLPSAGAAAIAGLPAASYYHAVSRSMSAEACGQ